MKLRLLTMAGLVAVTTSCFVVAGCSDDDTVDNPSGGAGGTSGAAGKGGAAGKSGGSNAAGKGGNGNKAGDSGLAGEEEQGGSGDGGKAAGGAGAGGSTAGTGGTVAGAGGAIAGSGGSAGKAGSAGTGGTSGSAGTAGSAGKGGSGGTAGTAGSSGSGGSGGSAAGTGGTAGSSAGTGGTAGSSAGTGGTSGSAGSAGKAGSGGTGGTAGSAGTAGSGGSGGGGVTATGVVKLTLPFTATGQSGNYLINLSSTVSLAAATIDSKVYIQTLGSAASFQYLLQFTSGSQTCTAFVNYTNVSSASTYAAGFATFSLNVGTLDASATTGYCASGTATLDKTQIKAVGFQVSDGTAASYSTSVVWLDSLTITGASPNVPGYSFDTTSPFTVDAFGTAFTTATATWQAAYP